MEEDLEQNGLVTSKETLEASSEIVSDGESESLSPPRVVHVKIIDSPHSLKQKLDHLMKHSIDAPFDSAAPCLGTPSASSPPTLSMLGRAQLFHDHVSQQASQTQGDLNEFPPTKWGRCLRADCGYSLAPHLYQSGRYAGEIRLLCSRFWKMKDGNRMCYFSVPCPPDRWCDLPRHLKQKHGELPAALRRHGNK